MLAGDPEARVPGDIQADLGRGMLSSKWSGRAGGSPTGPEAPTASPRWERVQLSRECWGLGCSALRAFQPVPGSRRSGGGKEISPPPPGGAPPPLLKQTRPWKTSELRSSTSRPRPSEGLKETDASRGILRSSGVFHSLFIPFLMQI